MFPTVRRLLLRYRGKGDEIVGDKRSQLCCKPKKVDSGLLFSISAPFLLVIHGLIGAGVFHTIETTGVWMMFSNESEKCLGNHNFGVTLYHVNAISTTFGYSKFFPCTPVGRGFAVVYCLLGLPVVFVVLNDVGRVAELFLQQLWNFGHRKTETLANRMRKLLGKPPVRRFRTDTPRPIPALFGLILAFVWIFLVAIFFDLTESDLDYGDSLFFTFITLTSIGLGEFSPQRYYYVQFWLFFIGLILFSTAVKIFQANLAAMIHQITLAVDEDFKMRMLAGDNSAGGQKKLDGMINAAGPFLRRLMPKDRQKELKEKFVALENLKVAGAQVNYELTDKMVDSTVKMVDQMVDASLGSRDQSSTAEVVQTESAVNATVGRVEVAEQTLPGQFRPYMVRQRNLNSTGN